jgi:hypothetical protein
VLALDKRELVGEVIRALTDYEYPPTTRRKGAEANGGGSGR